MSTIRANIVGSGLIAVKKHIPAYIKLKRKVELTAVCDVNVSAAQSVAGQFGIPRAYGSVTEMLDRERPSLVDICTPPQTHLSIAMEAIKHGCNVLIEKPMALTVPECDRILEAAKERGVEVCVAHSDLFYAPFIRAREAVARGEIGRFRGMRIFLSTPTRYMTSQRDHWAHRLPGGVIGESGPHVVYMTIAFLKNIRKVTVEGLKLLHDYPWSRFEDYRVTLIGDEGASSITLTYGTKQWAARVELLGEDGFLVLDLESMTLVRYRRKELTVVGVGFSLLSETVQMLAALLRNAAACVLRKTASTHEVIISQYVESILRKSAPPVSGEEGREAVRILGIIAQHLDAREVEQTVA